MADDPVGDLSEAPLETTSVLRYEMGWSGGVHELAFIARRRFQERKEGIWETDSIGGYDGRKSEPAWGGRR
jgi:hypothetical protein